jgi:L-aminopeptidase/D-esterase-like protein
MEIEEMNMREMILAKVAGARSLTYAQLEHLARMAEDGLTEEEVLQKAREAVDTWAERRLP